MVSYAAPLDDIRFLLYELLDYEGQVASLPGCEEASRELVDAVLEEGAKFCENELLPLNRPATRPAAASRTAWCARRKASRRSTTASARPAGTACR
jgi:hypothetical protein